MDYISGIQRAIDYIEANLTNEISYETAAKCAYTSSFHFQRLFSILCGFTLGDYIRCRRLSSAGEELIKNHSKVIDIALKYGYETPESFTRAFTRFHGVTPKEAKNGAKIKSYSKLSVKLILSGGNTMDYRIEKLDALKIICKRKEFAKPNEEYTNSKIPIFWNECHADGTIKKIVELIPEKPKLCGLLGICFDFAATADKFPYGIGTEYDGVSEVPDGLEIIDIPSNTYAVFSVKGKMPDAFAETYKKICTEFFPQSGYEYGNGVEFEVYPSADVDNPDYYCGIWIAVK